LSLIAWSPSTPVWIESIYIIFPDTEAVASWPATLIEAARLSAVSVEVAPARYSDPRMGDAATAVNVREITGESDADRMENRSPGVAALGTTRPEEVDP
jgi:hypothetical protein